MQQATTYQGGLWTAAPTQKSGQTAQPKTATTQHSIRTAQNKTRHNAKTKQPKTKNGQSGVCEINALLHFLRIPKKSPPPPRSKVENVFVVALSNFRRSFRRRLHSGRQPIFFNSGFGGMGGNTMYLSDWRLFRRHWYVPKSHFSDASIHHSCPVVKGILLTSS